MRIFFIFIGVLTLFIILPGCQNNENNIDGLDIYDFAFINKAPENKKPQDVQDIIKIYFNDGSSASNDNIALDLEKGELYKNVIMKKRGIYHSNNGITIENAKDFKQIIDTYKVHMWKEDYTFEAPETYEDGVGWSLYLQYRDGGVDQYGGQGSSINEITPENFEDFKIAIDKLVNDN